MDGWKDENFKIWVSDAITSKQRKRISKIGRLELVLKGGSKMNRQTFGEVKTYFPFNKISLELKKKKERRLKLNKTLSIKVRRRKCEYKTHDSKNFQNPFHRSPRKRVKEADTRSEEERKHTAVFSDRQIFDFYSWTLIGLRIGKLKE